MASEVTSLYVLATLWALFSPFQYGYATALLNQIQASVVCDSTSKTPLLPVTPPACIPMSDATFGIVTTSFTVGGLVGSACANMVMEKYGRRGTLAINAASVGIGSLVFTLAGSVPLLVAGRLFVGLGAGLGLCALPIYLSETAPPKLRSRVGVLNQLFICIGILATQAIGLPLAHPSSWRIVPLVSAIIAVVQLLSARFIPETPGWLATKGQNTLALSVSRKLWGPQAADDSLDGARSRPVSRLSVRRDALDDDIHPSLDSDVERAALLGGDEGNDRHRNTTSGATVVPPFDEPIGVLGLLRRRDLRRAVIVVTLAMMTQQGSGINAVIYYSTDILGRALPTNAAYISLLIAVLNVVMTFAPVFLIDRLGPRTLLLSSIGGAFVSTALLGYALDGGIVWLSSVAILAFVASFALGLGPVPFMLVGELVPFYATSPLSSFGLSLNWISNFIVGTAFLPLRNWLASLGNSRDTPPDEGEGQGRVFFVFAAILALCGISLSRLYR